MEIPYSNYKKKIQLKYLEKVAMYAMHVSPKNGEKEKEIGKE